MDISFSRVNWLFSFEAFSWRLIQKPLEKLFAPSSAPVLIMTMLPGGNVIRALGAARKV